jgi:hypothetical protein
MAEDLIKENPNSSNEPKVRANDRRTADDLPDILLRFLPIRFRPGSI